MRDEQTTERIESMTITEFLLARIAEDEEVANEAGERYDTDMSLWVVDDDYRHDIVGATDRRVLAECKAKRRIVEMHPVYDDSDQHDCPGEWSNYAGPGDPCPTLLALASVHADHPDYDAAWAV